MSGDTRGGEFDPPLVTGGVSMDDDGSGQGKDSGWSCSEGRAERNGGHISEENIPLQEKNGTASGEYENEKVPEEMTYDNLLTSLGEFGWRQKMICVLTSYEDTVFAMQIISTVFIMATVSHRCAIPWLANDTWTMQDDHHALLVNLTIPPGDQQPLSSCYIYAEAWTDLNTSADNTTSLTTAGWDVKSAGNGSGSLWHGSNSSTAANVTTCHRHVYDTSQYKSSLSMDLNLVCERRMYGSHAQMTIMLGCLVGSQLSGLIADLWGRKVSMMLCIVLNVASIFPLTFVQHYTVLLVIGFLVGMSAMGYLCTGFILSLELVGPNKRMWLAPYTAVGFSSGILIMSLLAYFLREWKHLHLACSAFTLPCLAYWWLIPESPRWLLNKGRAEEAKVILNQLARANKTTFDPRLLDKVKVNNSAEVSVWRLVSQARPLLARYLIVFFSWFTASLSYYGVSFNMGYLGGNIYVNMVVGALMDIGAILLCVPIMARVGRRPLTSVLFLITGLACIATLFPIIFASKDQQWMTVVLALIGKCSIAVNFSAIWVYGSELFPTVMRNSCLGAASMCARVGGILAPYVANMAVDGAAGKAIPLVIFGAPAILVSLLTLCLPETFRQPLPDSVQDAVFMNRKNTKGISTKV